MSIEMENPKTALELVDAASNLVAQMMLAHRMRDESRFNEVHEKAADFLHRAVQVLDGAEGALNTVSGFPGSPSRDGGVGCDSIGD